MSEIISFLTPASIHALIIIMMCSAGIVASTFAILILTRQELRTIEHIKIGQRLQKHHDDMYAKSKLN